MTGSALVKAGGLPAGTQLLGTLPGPVQGLVYDVRLAGLAARLDGVELVSVCNRSRASSQRISDQYDVPKIYENWVDLIKAVM